MGLRAGFEGAAGGQGLTCAQPSEWPDSDTRGNLLCVLQGP